MGIWDFLRARFTFGNGAKADERELNKQVEAAVALLQAGEYPEAQAVLLKVAKHDESCSFSPEYLRWVLGWLWITWEQTQDYGSAIECYSKFASRHPDNSDCLQYRAMSYWYEGNFNGALGDYSRALELDSSDASAFLGRGQVLMERGEFSRAMEDLRQALSSIDKVSEANSLWKKQFEAYARNGLGAAHAGLGDMKKASEEFEKSVELCPNNAWVYFNRAEASRKRGDGPAASQDYHLALSKKEPRLTPRQRGHAEKMLRELGS